MQVRENIHTEFDAFAKNYTSDMEACVPHYRALLACFGQHFEAGFRPERILDLGCGNGNVTAQLLEHYSDADYTLVDASEEMLRLCRARFADYTVKTVRSYFDDFDFETEVYDLVVGGFSIHHCEAAEKQHLFGRIYAALKPGGYYGCADLMVNKAQAEHAPLLVDWSSFVHQNFPDGDKWDWMMEHYAAFDRPDFYGDQMTWLQTAGFDEVSTPFRDGFWTYLQARKTV